MRSQIQKLVFLGQMHSRSNMTSKDFPVLELYEVTACQFVYARKETVF